MTCVAPWASAVTTGTAALTPASTYRRPSISIGSPARTGIAVDARSAACRLDRSRTCSWRSTAWPVWASVAIGWNSTGPVDDLLEPHRHDLGVHGVDEEAGVHDRPTEQCAPRVDGRPHDRRVPPRVLGALGATAQQPCPVQRPGGAAVDGVEQRQQAQLLDGDRHAAGVGTAGAPALDQEHQARVVAAVSRSAPCRLRSRSSWRTAAVTVQVIAAGRRGAPRLYLGQFLDCFVGSGYANSESTNRWVGPRRNVLQWLHPTQL